MKQLYFAFRDPLLLLSAFSAERMLFVRFMLNGTYEKETNEEFKTALFSSKLNSLNLRLLVDLPSFRFVLA